ncbi:hypothetical protein B0I00_2327 [Novosphingobium kunmingense]|uniref:Uncharacterized protein n=1 Tax=Novosphingobium kunmingense TaxID=1211806 RepID=A0A2N0H706_9SPHN|nr:hypothetical protein [Novosphingobium kunmingense]PKB14729.1 hypothetical protein B0I00_2327 [Novosphingobium kunmingense]
MATLAGSALAGPDTTVEPRGDAFFARMAIVMALTVVAGFSFQLAMGRSTFASPLRVHIHAVLFMGWVAIFVLQSQFATRGPIALHRKLGWLAVGWMFAMLTAAMVVIVAMARNGTVPFFFTPQHFLIADPFTLLGFMGLTGAAVALRRDTDWHARLHVGGMAVLTGPAFGRLIPMPLLVPYAFEAAGVGSALFLVAGMVRDKRRSGAVHPAWWIGMAVLVGTLVFARVLANSPVGDAIYQAAVAGYPGADIPGLEYPAPPGTPLRTGQ